MAAPRYFQTEDEKRLAQSRLTIGGRPVQMVRPMLPSNYDATEVARWGKNEFGQSNIPIERYMENSRKMRTVENVPTAAPEEKMSSKDILAKYGGAQTVQGSDNRPSGVYEKGKLVESDNRSPGVYDEKGERISPYRPPVAPTSNWQQDVVKKYPDIGKKGTPMQQKFTQLYKEEQDAGRTLYPWTGMSIANEINSFYGPGTYGAASIPDYSSPTAPTPQDIAEMEKAGTADMSPRFSPIEMRGSTLNAWQSGSLAPLIDKTDPYGTMLNDRPGGGRTYESFSRPMGSGTLSQRPTSTASGASERVAARRAVIMDPKSSEEDRRWARKIRGSTSNQSYGNYD